MNLKLSVILLILTAFSVMSCKTSFRTRVYRFVPYINPAIHSASEITKILSESDRKLIFLESNSVLVYAKLYGDLASPFSIDYKIVNNELITDSLSHDGYSVPNITNMIFFYSKDSLVNKKTNERYLTNKYYKVRRY